jgi:hypothetical protein
MPNRQSGGHVQTTRFFLNPQYLGGFHPITKRSVTGDFVSAGSVLPEGYREIDSA